MESRPDREALEILAIYWDDVWRRYEEAISDITFLRNRARNLFLSCAGLQIVLLTQIQNWNLDCKNKSLIILIVFLDLWLLLSYSGIERPFSPPNGDYDRSKFLRKIEYDQDLNIDDLRSQILSKEKAVLAYQEVSTRFHREYAWMIGAGTLGTILTVTLFIKQSYGF